MAGACHKEVGVSLSYAEKILLLDNVEEAKEFIEACGY